MLQGTEAATRKSKAVDIVAASATNAKHEVSPDGRVFAALATATALVEGMSVLMVSVTVSAGFAAVFR